MARRRGAVGTQFRGCAGAIVPADGGSAAFRCGARAVFVTTLHPDVMGRRFLWQAESGVTVSNAFHSLVETDDYRVSPFTTVYATRKPLRRRFADPDCPTDYEVLQDMRAHGATDYVAFPLVFTDGTIHVATWSTRQPGGFTARQFADIESVIAPLARVAEIRALRRTSEKSDRHVCRSPDRGAYPFRQDSPRLRRGDPRGDLVVGYARLYLGLRETAAAGTDRPFEPLFRLPGTGGARSRRRGAQVHG